MSVEDNLKCKTVKGIVNKDLGRRSSRKRVNQCLTVTQEIKILQWFNKFLKRNVRKNVNPVIFYDEKLYCTKQCYNGKNDVVYTATFLEYTWNHWNR